jgi:hypothetical protein
MPRAIRHLQAAGAIIAAMCLLAPTPVAPDQTLKRLQGVAEVKGWFNANAGHPRIIFLLSPT